MQQPYYLADDCPHCGQKDAPQQWKGARMGSSSWGHGYACCSHECGEAFGSSPKRVVMDIERLQNKISALKNELKCLVKELKRMKQGRRQAD